MPVRHTAANGLPLGAEVNRKFTKYIYLDSGLLLSILQLDFGGVDEINELILAGAADDLVNKGKLAEMIVGWELVKYRSRLSRTDLYYWENLSRGASAEIDYVMAREMHVLPIEVKSGTSGKMKSMWNFLELKRLPLGIRTSLENFAQIDSQRPDLAARIDLVPLYALSNLF
jgi:predicted AAA+ superfamily ATPase